MISVVPTWNASICTVMDSLLAVILNLFFLFPIGLHPSLGWLIHYQGTFLPFLLPSHSLPVSLSYPYWEHNLHFQRPLSCPRHWLQLTVVVLTLHWAWAWGLWDSTWTLFPSGFLSKLIIPFLLLKLGFSWHHYYLSHGITTLQFSQFIPQGV